MGSTFNEGRAPVVLELERGFSRPNIRGTVNDERLMTNAELCNNLQKSASVIVRNLTVTGVS